MVLRLVKWLFILIVMAIVVDLILVLFWPWYFDWGASKTEVRQVMPADELVIEAKTQTTRAVTIDAAPDEVWPWIIQMGYERAGWYNYDFINRLMGAANFVDGHQSSDRIVPELQNLKVGDEIRIAAPIAYTVYNLIPNRLLVLNSKSATENHNWVFLLEPQSDGQTRLIVRHRDNYTGFLSSAIYTLIEPGAFFMERQNLLGIKSRAEHLTE